MKRIRNYFTLTKSEIRGLFIVFFMIATLVVLRISFRPNADGFHLTFHASDRVTEEGKPGMNRNQISAGETGLPSGGSIYEEYSESFDPNAATYGELLSKGFASHVVNRIINYRLKGGKYNRPEDLLKIYGIDSTLVYVLSENMIFNSTYRIPENEFKKKNVSDRRRIDINKTDSIQLRTIFGIGTVLSARIIKYRDLLGGFYSAIQLAEVYGINDSLCSRLSEVFFIDTTCIKKMNVNKATINELKKHPYLNYYQAEAITSYRRLVGPFDSKKQLIDNYILTETTYLKVTPYLTLE